MRRIALIPAVAAVVTAAFTGITVWLGPEPVVRTHSVMLNVPSYALSEPVDRFVLAGWWAIAIVMALGVGWGLRRGRRARARPARGAVPQWAVAALGVVASGVIVTSLLWQDETGLWPGISTLGLMLGAAFALCVFRFWSLPRWFGVAVSVAVVGLVLSYALPVLLQTPGTIRSPIDFQYTSDEIAAVAAGRFPLSDYVPQYSVLLGFPVAPLLTLLGARAVYGVVAWLLLLQVVALAVSVVLPALVGGWRMLAPAVALAVVPTLSGLPTAYFAAIPLRVVLPALCILAAFLTLRHRRPLTRRLGARVTWLGVALGLTVLNNPDFGGPAAATVLVVTVIAVPGLRQKAVAASALIVGSLVPFGLYTAAGAVSGHPVHWSQWLIFQKAFGAEGFNSVAMKPFGLHIAFVTLFISAAVTGYALLIRYRGGGSRFGYQQGLLLALVGGWSLLAMPYFSGRSMAPTLVAGYAYMVGMTVAAFLPLLRTSVRALWARPGHGSVELAVALSTGSLAVAGAASTLLLVNLPSHNYALVASVPPGRLQDLVQLTGRLQALRDQSADDLETLIGDGRVEQALDMASLTGLATGVRSGSLATHSDYFDLSPVFTDLQCTLPWDEGVDYLLVTDVTAAAFERQPSCAAHFDFSQQRVYPVADATLVMLPRR